MMKLVGAALLTGASTLTGIYFSRVSGEKASQLYKIRSLISETITLLRYRSSTVYEIADELESEYSSLGFIKYLCKNLEHGKAFYPIWENAVLSDVKLSESEKELLLSAGSTLGNCDVEGQISALSVCVQRLDKMINTAVEENRRKTPLYRGLGLLAGLFASVLLM